MKEHIVAKEFIISLFVIAFGLVAVLGGYALGRYYKGNDVVDNNSNEVNTNKTYEKISDEELETYSMSDSTYESFNESLFLLIEQDNDIENVKEFLSDDYYNDWIIFKVLANKFFNENKTSVTKDEVIGEIKKMFGYEIDVKFHDILDDLSDNSTGFRWHEDTQTYTCDEVAFAHGGYFGYNIYDFYKYVEFDKKVVKDYNNVYTVTAKIVWMDQKWATEGPDVSKKYYATYNDVKNNKNEIVSLTENSETWFDEVPYNGTDDDYYKQVNDYIYKQSNSKMNTYEYKLVKENGIIRILSYKKID